MTYIYLQPQPPSGRCPETYLHPGPLSTSLPFLLSPGVATYTDKLFKFRSGRWEDILSDEVNVARGVASLFAGRSVACVDRTVSSGVRGGPGAKWGGTQRCESQRGANRHMYPECGSPGQSPRPHHLGNSHCVLYIVSAKY